MSFLLSVNYLPNGTAQFQYDDGPTRRVQLVTLAEHAHEVLNTSADQLLGNALSDIRPPVGQRNTARTEEKGG